MILAHSQTRESKMQYSGKYVAMHYLEPSKFTGLK